MPFTPDTFVDGVAGNTPITAAKLNNLEQGVVADDGTNPASAEAMHDAATFVPYWAPATVYAAGKQVVSPNNDVVSAIAAHTSGASFNSANWNLSTNATTATTMYASRYGVVGDGVTDDAAALNSLLSSAATFGASVTLTQGSTVLISSVTVTIPSGTRLDLNGATIKSALPNTGDRLITVSGVSNVIIRNGILDGNKTGFAATTEQRHNLIIKNSSRVSVHDLQSINAKGDGVYVGDQSGYSSDVYLERVICDGNWRNGMSISHVSGFVAVGCIFRNSQGTNPQAGVDVEPNNGSVVCENIKFIGCTFSGNYHFGFLVSFNFAQTAHQGNIDLVGCTFTGNGVANDGGGGGIFFAQSTDVTVTGGSIRGNTGPGILLGYNSQPTSNIKIEGVTIENNSTHGVYAQLTVTSLMFISCAIRNNGTAAANTYDGLSLTPGGSASVGIRLFGNQVTGSGQRYGLNTSTAISGLVSVGNDYSGNGTAATTLGDDVTTRIQLDTNASSLSSRAIWWSGSAATLQSFRLTGDTNDRLAFLTDGRVLWGSGSATSDAQLSRLAAGVVGTGPAQTFRTGVAVTASRPSAATVGKGSMFYDSTLSKPIWSDGTNWKDATGTTV